MFSFLSITQYGHKSILQYDSDSKYKARFNKKSCNRWNSLYRALHIFISLSLCSLPRLSGTAWIHRTTVAGCPRWWLKSIHGFILFSLCSVFIYTTVGAWENYLFFTNFKYDLYNTNFVDFRVQLYCKISCQISNWINILKLKVIK